MVFLKYGAFIISSCSLLLVVGGHLFTLGKIKESTVTKDKLKETIDGHKKQCNGDVVNKIDELKDLVVLLHDKQSEKIEKMDNKRETAKSQNNEELMKINASIGKISGYIEAIKDQKGKV